MTGRRRRGERGAAAVEFALVVPLLVALVLGIAEFGRAYHVVTTITGAAREGARVMALTNDPAQARDRAQSAAAPTTLSSGQIVFTPTSCSPGAAVEVTITYPFESVMGPNFSLKGKGSMRCNG
jgi:Flp pilus assembly protein TadG